jgi:hypothetical protein
LKQGYELLFKDQREFAGLTESEIVLEKGDARRDCGCEICYLNGF